MYILRASTAPGSSSSIAWSPSASGACPCVPSFGVLLPAVVSVIYELSVRALVAIETRLDIRHSSLLPSAVNELASAAIPHRHSHRRLFLVIVRVSLSLLIYDTD